MCARMSAAESFVYNYDDQVQQFHIQTDRLWLSSDNLINLRARCTHSVSPLSFFSTFISIEIACKITEKLFPFIAYTLHRRLLA